MGAIFWFETLFWFNLEILIFKKHNENASGSKLHTNLK